MAFDSVSAPARYISSNGQYGGYGQTDGCVVVRWAWGTYAERMGEFWEGRNFTCAPLLPYATTGQKVGVAAARAPRASVRTLRTLGL